MTKDLRSQEFQILTSPKKIQIIETAQLTSESKESQTPCELPIVDQLDSPHKGEDYQYINIEPSSTEKKI